MNIRKSFSKGLVGLTLLLSGGCASVQANRNESPNLEKEIYVLNYDQTPIPLAIEIYKFANNTEENPQDMAQLNPYLRSPLDLNGNGVLDIHHELTVTRDGGEIVGLYERRVRRAEATASGREELIQEVIITQDGHGGFFRLVTEPVTLDSNVLGRVLRNYTGGVYMQEIEDTGIYIREIRLRNTPSQSPPQQQNNPNGV